MTVFSEPMDGDLDCDGSASGRCKGLRRTTTLLRYHHRLMGSAVVNPGRIFTEFCDVSYPKRVATNDYVHYIQKHSDDASRRHIAKELGLKCTAIGQCGGSQRHYGRREPSADGLAFHPMLEQFDSLHFNLLHIEEAGFRVAAAGNDGDEKVDADEMEDGQPTDTAMEIVTQRVRALQKEFEGERLGGGSSGKFNISVLSEETQLIQGILVHFG